MNFIIEFATIFAGLAICMLPSVFLLHTVAGAISRHDNGGWVGLGGCAVFFFISLIYLVDWVVWDGLSALISRLSQGLIVFTVVVIFCFLLAMVALYLSSRKKRISVFLSYNHLDFDLVKNVNQRLEALGFIMIYLPFEEKTGDEVAHFVRSSMKRADLVVAIPGLTRNSFADAEIISAYQAEKPIIFIIDNKSRSLPSTALLGHPVFLLSVLEDYNFEPLRHFINFLFFSKEDIKNTMERIADRQLYNIFYWAFFVYAVMRGGASVWYAWLFGENYTVFMFYSMLVISIALEMSIVFGGLLWAILSRKRAQEAVRQLAANREFTFDAVQDVLGATSTDELILKAMLKNPLTRSGES